MKEGRREDGREGEGVGEKDRRERGGGGRATMQVALVVNDLLCVLYI